MTKTELESQNKVRQSSLELYRVIIMLLIVAHHYVANSGLVQMAYESPLTPNSLFILLFSAWGKPGINCFVLITGYYMCQSRIMLKKYLKLILEVYFYKVVIYTVFVLSGYELFSLKGLLRVITPTSSLESNFTGCFLLFYLFIPFLNILVCNLKEKQHLFLIILCLVLYTGFGGFDGLSFFKVEMNYVSWFIVLYFIGSFIRLHPRKLFSRTFLWGGATIIVLCLSCVSVVAGAWMGQHLGQPKLAFFFVSDSNKILALAIGVCSFLFFKNLKMGYSKIINIIGASTFGVLQIHANSYTMRQWLWVDTLHNTAMFESEWLILHAFGSVLLVFFACVLIDLVRKRIFETPFFRWFDKHWENIQMWYEKKEQAICGKMNIEN